MKTAIKTICILGTFLMFGLSTVGLEIEEENHECIEAVQAEVLQKEERKQS